MEVQEIEPTGILALHHHAVYSLGFLYVTMSDISRYSVIVQIFFLKHYYLERKRNRKAPVAEAVGTLPVTLTLTPSVDTALSPGTTTSISWPENTL